MMIEGVPLIKISLIDTGGHHGSIPDLHGVQGGSLRGERLLNPDSKGRAVRFFADTMPPPICSAETKRLWTAIWLISAPNRVTST